MIVFLIALACALAVPVFLLWLASPGKLTPFRGPDKKALPGSLSEKIRVEINGVDQGMFIRGKSASSPVLLFVHGGPGMPEIFMNQFYPNSLEEHFIVCWWEQRGAGFVGSARVPKSTLTVEQSIQDVITASEYLRARFGRDKIYLLCHSWGSFLGIQAAARRPDLYTAYIGMGQAADMRQSEIDGYRYMLGEAARLGDRPMLKKLNQYPVLERDRTFKPYVFSSLRDAAMHRLGIGTTHAMRSVVTGIFIPSLLYRGYTLQEKANLWRAKFFLKMKTEYLDILYSTDLCISVTALAMPVYFISGRYDYSASIIQSKRFHDRISAPVKGFYTFEHSAHSPLFEEPDRMMRILTEDVLEGKTGLSDH